MKRTNISRLGLSLAPAPVRSVIALALFLVLLTSLPIWNSRAQSSPDPDPDEPPAQQPVFSTGSNPELRRARKLTRRYLRDHQQVFRLDHRNRIKVQRSWVDELAMAHVRVQQTFDDVPVFGGEAIVHWKTDGTLSRVTNSWVSDLQVDTTPSLTAEVAAGLAVAPHGCTDCLARPPKLWVLRHEKVDRLAYEVRMRPIEGRSGPSMPVYFVDAHSGGIIWTYDNLQTATGTSYYGEVSFNTLHQGDNYYLEDSTRRIGTYSYRNGTSTAFNITDSDDIWTNGTAVSTQYGMSMVIDYFKNVHGRNGLNGDGGPYFTISQDGVTPLFAARINYSSNYSNAFWNGSFLTFGDGDGSSFSPLVTLDIIGHEMTHVLTENTAGLIYSGESGALNESISDVFGALAERYARGESDNTWMTGEECFTPGTPGDALRYLDDPHRAGNSGYTLDDDPDHYSERYRGQSDNQGVHVNTGIPSKAFYLLSKGGTHHLGGSMTGIGVDDAARIWYKALTNYMTQTTDFAGARIATQNAAIDLFGVGSAQLAAVSNAWCLVGVGEGNCNGTESEAATELQNGVPISNLSGSSDSQKLFYLSVPPGATNLSFQIAGGSGDADLYVRFVSPPTLTSYDCRPYTQGNTETCNLATPAAGYWFVMIRGYVAYSGLTLTGSYTPPGSNELIVNGGFERSALPWVLSGAAAHANDFSAHNGTGYVYLGQTDSATGVANQQFSIPGIALAANLTFYLNVSSNETTRTAEHDQLFVEVLSSSGRLLQTLATYSNLDKGRAGVYSRKGSFSLLNYRGRTVKLQFRARTNGRLPTTFRIDDVSVK